MAPLRFDQEYQDELEKALRPIRVQNRLYWWIATLGLAGTLAGVTWWLRATKASPEVLVVAVISVSAVWMAGVISAGFHALLGAITLNICAVEWA